MENDVITRLGGFQSQLLRSIHGLVEGDLCRREREGAWSILHVISHLGDLETVTAVRIRMIVAQEDASLPALAQNQWVENVHPGETLASALEYFWAARRGNLSLIQRLSEADLSRRGAHPDYGSVSITDILSRLDAHEDKHLRQIERIKTTLGLIASERSHLDGVVSATVDAAPKRSPGEGIVVHDLWSDGVKRALLVKFAPGAQWPGLDYHVPGPEAVYVISGDLDDGANVHRAGTFLHHPAGTSHSPRSDQGCELFVYYPEG